MFSIREAKAPRHLLQKRTLFFPICIAFVLESLGIPRVPERGRMFQHKKPSTMNSHDRPMCVQGDSGLVLTTDPKPRLRWTVELHERFVDAVTQLGGPDSEVSFLCSTYPYILHTAVLLSHLQSLYLPYTDFIAFFCLLSFSECRGHTQNHHESHGCEGSHPLPPQEPPTGLNTTINFILLLLSPFCGVPDIWLARQFLFLFPFRIF